MVRLFHRHFEDSISAIQRLEKNLQTVALPFGSLNEQLRELPFPAQPCLPNGSPSFIYYFVPGSGWGTQIPAPKNPLDSGFTLTADGIGMNMGCPVRLAHALDALSRLRPEDQLPIKNELRVATKHLAIVEELLWLHGWKALSQVRRGGNLVGNGDVDWFLDANGYPLYLEAKFRPSDWARLSDDGTHRSAKGALLKNAAKKFPLTHKGVPHIVGITGLGDLTEEFVHDFGVELEMYPQIHGLIYRSLSQMTHAISLYPGIVKGLLDTIEQPSIREFPTNYIVNWHIGQRNERVAKRNALSSGEKTAVSKVICRGIEPRYDAEVVTIPEDSYRIHIDNRGFDGEPIFRVAPRELWR